MSPAASKIVSEASQRLRDAYQTRVPCRPIRDIVAAGDVAAAYAAQNRNTEIWIGEGRRPVGAKIGLTSKSVQAQLGVDQPDYGILFDDMGAFDGEDIPLSQLHQPKIEGEVAFRLEKDILLERPTVADLLDAIAYALPAFEIVGSRIADWDITLVDTIADNASSGMFVLGGEAKRVTDLDLRLCGMALEADGQEASLGAGLACLGNPLNAFGWLAAKMVDVGRPLKAGDIVLSGALGPMVPVTPGVLYDLRISGLGSVRTRIVE